MPKVGSLWFEGSQQLDRSFTIQKIFAIAKEAEEAGLAFATKWIDDGKPLLADQVDPIIVNSLASVLPALTKTLDYNPAPISHCTPIDKGGSPVDLRHPR
jgi:hypothetical protein